MMKKNLLTLFFLIGLIGLKAQSIITLGSGLDTSGTTDSSPINIYYKSHHCQILYKASELNTAGWIGQGIISKLGFNIYGTTSEGLPNFSIKLKNISTSTVDVYDGNAMTTVYSSALYSPVAGGFELLNLGSSFIWDGTSNLLVDVCFDQVGTYTGTGRVYTYTYTNTGSEYKYIRDDSAPQCGVATSQAMPISKPQLQLELTTPPACSGMPMTDAATSSSTLTCPNTSFYLGLTNTILNSGFVYQWQSSLDGSLWNNMGSQQTSTSYSIASITDTTYYRCLTTCTVSAQTNTSIPIVVNFNPLINCYCLPNYSWTCTNDNFINFSLSNIVSQSTGCDPSGYSDSTSSNYTIINLNAANTYTLLANATVSGFYGDAAMGAWIDYNQNSVFEPAEFTSLGFGPSGTYSNTLTVPLTSPSGLVRMRLKLDEYYASSGTVLDPCINNNGTYNGQTLDFKVNITAAPACSGAPNAGNATSTQSAVCQNVPYTLDLTGNDVVSGVTYQWQSSPNGTTWTNLGTVQSTIAYSVASQSVTTYYQCVITCTSVAMSGTSTPVVVNQNLPTACYCVPESISCSSSQITNITFETINDNPTCGVNAYTDNTIAISTVSLTANQTYTISSILNIQGGTGYVGCWIDYDQNGIFDSYEYNNLGNTSSSYTVIGNINIPFTALGGNTRMRFKMESTFGIFNGILDGCNGINYDGQTIDYSIYITPSTPCSGSPNAGDANSTISSVCENTPFTLDLINNDIVSNISYQWQSSPDNVIWTNIGSSQITVPYTISSQSVTTHYRCLTTCTTSALTSTSTPWAVIQNPVTTCYCIPEPSDCMSGDEINYVAFATITNTSACDGTNGYSDYTGSVSSATINAGQSYTLTTRLGYMFGEHVYAWIDYDQNGMFDPSEYTDLGSNSGNDTIKNPINIPTSALTGTTRMRVRNYSGTGLGPNDACVSPTGGAKLLMPIMGYGETEDYLVTILPPDCSVINFPPTIALSGNLDICPGGSTTLDLTTALPAATGITYQWKYYNGTTYVNAGAANSTSSFTDAPSVNTPYFCEILCNGTPVRNTDTVFVKVQTITTAPTSSSVTCNSLCNGSATMNASSFGATLTYAWLPTGGTSDISSSLCAGSYTVNISNPTGCGVTETLTIVEPVALTSSLSQTDVTCNGLNNGIATVTVTGGVSPLTFSWLPSGGTALTANNLSAGNYTFNISDGNGCSLNQTVAITEPSPLTVTVSNVVGTCFGGSAGQAEMLVSGGTIGYNYSWTSGGSSQLETGLSIGTQTCTITDANSCTITETVSIAQTSANFSLSISGVSNICEQLEDSVTSSIIGGSGSFSYSWLELPTSSTSINPNFTYTASVGSYSYNLTVTDNISNCVVNSNTLALVVNPSSNFSGVVTTNTAAPVPVAGIVVLYKYLPFFTKFDSVASQTIGAAGDFLFTSFNSGTYIIKAIPTATNMQITYGDTAVNWKTAKLINHGCLANDIQNISVKPLTVLTNTTGISGTLSGGIYGGPSYGQRMGDFGQKPTIPGTPIGGIIVKGGKNPGGQMFVQTITDPTTGTYTLSGLPANTGNESYFILVDIPGLDTNGTYHRIIDFSNNNFQGLDFLVDSAKINPLPSSVISVHDVSAIENEIKVFPNPASNYVSIQYNLKNSSLVKIELFDMLGKTVKILMPETQQSMEIHKKSWQMDDVRSGLYFIKMTINGAESIIKLSVTN